MHWIGKRHWRRAEPASRCKTPEGFLIVAAAENGVIGQGNAFPWRLKTDQLRPKALTMGKPIVMGRKTFLSWGRPSPGRTNIVITRDTNFHAAGAVVTTSLAQARDVARGDAMRRSVSDLAIIGGVEIYAQTLAAADRVDLTLVHAMPDGDAHFAPFDPANWTETARERHAAGAVDSADFSYVTYRRAAAD